MWWRSAHSHPPRSVAAAKLPTAVAVGAFKVGNLGMKLKNPPLEHALVAVAMSSSIRLLLAVALN